MKKPAVSRKRVAIDTVPLPEKTFGMKTKKAKVSKVRGKYYVNIGRRKLEIPIGLVISAKDVTKLVGKDAFVVLSNKRSSEIVAIGTWPTPEKPIRIRCYLIMCNIPAPDMLRRVQPTIRETLLNKMVSTKIMTSKLARQIKANMPR